MPIDIRNLFIALSEPVIAAMSDADAAASLSAPILAVRPGRLTMTDLIAVWGMTIAATFRGGLKIAIAGGGQMGAVADTVLGLLDGPGFDASDPNVAQTLPVLISANLCTAEEAQAVIYLPPTYRCGAPVTAADVTAARAAMAWQTQKQTVLAAGAGVWNVWVSAVEASTQASELPVAATLPGGKSEYTQ